MRHTGIFSAAALNALERECDAGEKVAQAKCKIARAGVARMRSINDLARSNFRDALELLRGQGETELEADCLSGLAEIARMQDENEKARGLYEQARDLYRRANYPAGMAWCDRRLASL